MNPKLRLYPSLPSPGGGRLALCLQPLTLAEARRFVDLHHRHHRAPQGGLWAIGLNEAEQVVGVAIVGRPVARLFDDSWTAEVTSSCLLEGHPNAASKLYAACWRAARAMGYRRLITYVLKEESGTSVRAAGWRELYTTAGGTWNRPDRPRVDRHPLGPKVLWEVTNG